MEDSFAERMRKRALERLERNAHLIQPDDDVDYPSLCKKAKSPLHNEQDNKENKTHNTAFVSIPTRPVIAEHLTVRKSLIVDDTNCDEPGAFVMRNSRKPSLFQEENCPVEAKREDVYVKQCKSRLANLAGRYKNFEDELPPHPTAKKQPLKRKSPSKGTVQSPEKMKFCGNLRSHVLSPRNTSEKTKPCQNVQAFTQLPRNAHEKTKLNENVVQSLECQGYTRIDDAHLTFDFKKNVSKENVDVNPIPKPKRRFEVAATETTKMPACSEKEKPQRQEVSNLYSNSKYQNNIFIQNSRKEEAVVSNSEPDPCLLSVAERRKLFEKRMRGDIEEKSTEEAAPATSNTIHDEEIFNSPDEDADFNSGNDYSTCESDNNANGERNRSRTPTSDEEFNSEQEEEQTPQKEADLSQYPMLESVKKVKFMSTPKPGRLYPSVSDLDGEVEEDLNISKPGTSFKSPNAEDSFGQEVLCATNSIFSSFQNSRKETSNVDKTKQDLLNEVRDLISPGDETSLSLSPTARSSLASIECPNETASFTYLKPYASNSIDESSRVCKKTTEVQLNVGGEEENDTKTEENDEITVNQKIRYLEEHIVKEKIQKEQKIRALKYCLSTSFVNSTSHLEAEKLVLLSQLRIEELQNEIQRIKVEKSVRPYSATSNSVRGNVVISKIKLPIKMSFVHSNLKDDIENNLICIIKCGEVVLATEVMPVVQSKIKQDVDCTYIEFPDTITVPDVTSDFKIRVEVYNLVVERKDSYVKNKDKDKKNLSASKKSKKAKLFSTSYNNHKDKKNTHSSFQMVGYMIFSQSLAQRHQWMLNKHHLPLVGMIIMELKCNLAKITVEKHGFLTMYEIISGYGAWSRYWFYLNGDKLSFWKYPEQETVQDSIGTFDLKKCITKEVVVVGYDIVFRPQTFILKFDPTTYLKQFKNLSEDRLLLSADTEEERISWCERLNDVLKSVRSWSSSSE